MCGSASAGELGKLARLGMLHSASAIVRSLARSIAALNAYALASVRAPAAQCARRDPKLRLASLANVARRPALSLSLTTSKAKAPSGCLLNPFELARSLVRPLASRRANSVRANGLCNICRRDYPRACLWTMNTSSTHTCTWLMHLLARLL